MVNKRDNLENIIKSYGAVPSRQQIEYQKEELSAFIHFTLQNLQ